MISVLLADLSAGAVIAGGVAAVWYPLRSRMITKQEQDRERRRAHERREMQASIDESIKEAIASMHQLIAVNDAKTDKVATDVQALALRFASEVGGNSGGIRQAVNQISTDVAALRGAFEEHIREGVRR